MADNVTSLPTKLMKQKNMEAEARTLAYEAIIQIAEDFRDGKAVGLMGPLFMTDGGHSRISICTGKLSMMEVIGALECFKSASVLDAIVEDDEEGEEE